MSTSILPSIAIGRPLFDAVKLCVGAKQPFILEGDTGIGKSEICKATADTLGLEFIVCDLSLMEPVDLIGLPQMNNSVTSYAPPGFLPREGNGILFFEELNRSSAQVRAPCLQLLTARKLHEYRLPDGWHLGAAINPSEGGDYVDTFDLDQALLARFSRLRVHADVGEWMKWAELNSVSADVMEFVGSTPDIFRTPGSNPRAWTKVSNVLAANQGSPVGELALTAVVSGLVGSVMAAAFFSSRRGAGVKLPKADEIVKGYTTKQANMVKMAREQKFDDQIAALAHQVMVRLQDPDIMGEIMDNDKRLCGIRRFSKDLPPELARQMMDQIPGLAEVTP